jgi:hypothetical protein
MENERKICQKRQQGTNVLIFLPLDKYSAIMMLNATNETYHLISSAVGKNLLM